MEENSLSNSLKAKVDKNYHNAVSLKENRESSHPYKKQPAVIIDKTTIKIGYTKFKDTGGGFLLEENSEPNKETDSHEINYDTVPQINIESILCVKCNKPFKVSWLYENFSYKCCDGCKDEEEHKLITKTDALKNYLLKDCDLSKREPPLKFILRNNPHNSNWGKMKLYLELQVKERALEVWGDEDKIDEAKLVREEKRVVAKSKKYQKELKQLRMNIRSSLYDRTAKGPHVHNFEGEIYDEEKDVYRRKCLECPYVEEYEKL